MIIKGQVNRLLMVLVSSFLAGGLFGASSHAETYYVANNGSSNSSCESAKNPTSPKKRILEGIGCLSGGDTLIIKDGTYDEQIEDGIPSGSSWGSATTIRAENTRKVVLSPSLSGGQIIVFSTAIQYVILDGLILDGLNTDSTSGSSGGLFFVDGSGAKHIRFTNGEIRNFLHTSTGHPDGVRGGTGTSDIQVINSFIHDLSGADPQPGTHGFYWRSSNGIIEHNEIYNVSGFGIQVFSNSGVPVENNIIRNNIIHDAPGKGGMVFGGTSKNNLVYNNIIYNSRKGIKYNGTNNKIYNNTIYNIEREGIQNAPDGVIKNNILYQIGRLVTSDSSNFVSDPNFVDAANGDFHLESGSDAIDAGVTLIEVSDDLTGMSRPQGNSYDMGAYEFVGSSVDNDAPPPPTNLRVDN